MKLLSKQRLRDVAYLLLIVVFVGSGVGYYIRANYYVGPRFGYMTEHGSGKIYRREGVTAEQVQLAGEVIAREGAFSPGHPAEVQIRRTKTNFQLRLIVQKGAEEVFNFVESWRFIAQKLSEEVFGGVPCELVLCNEQFEPLLKH